MKELPTVEPADTPPKGGQGAGQPPERPQISSVRLMATLTTAGALAGLVIVLVFGWADPQIQAQSHFLGNPLRFI